jgi:hypothetical protein
LFAVFLQISNPLSFAIVPELFRQSQPFHNFFELLTFHVRLIYRHPTASIILAALALAASAAATAQPRLDPQELEQIQDGLLDPERK